jgi:hypothetical protein
MNDLLHLALAAHGGLERWLGRSEITAHVSIGGSMWAGKGHEGIFADTRVHIDPHQRRTTYDSFGTPDRCLAASLMSSE